MALLRFPGADRVLTAHRGALPQPDQLCGPFSAHVALHALVEASEVPTIGDIAAASGSAIWPYDVAEWRPTGVRSDRTDWDGLPRARSREHCGTSLDGLRRGVEALAADQLTLLSVPAAELASPALRYLLVELMQSSTPVGIVANLRTGPIAPDGVAWDVGHFVVLVALDPEQDDVLIGDTYVELTKPGMPPGCRTVSVAALSAALCAPPGRGLLVLL